MMLLFPIFLMLAGTEDQLPVDLAIEGERKVGGVKKAWFAFRREPLRRATSRFRLDAMWLSVLARMTPSLALSISRQACARRTWALGRRKNPNLESR